MVDIRRNLLVLVLMLAMIVTLSYLLMTERRGQAVSASLRFSASDVDGFAETAERSPFHRKRAEEFFVMLTDEGDRAYEAENWRAAGDAYGKALQLSPLDPGLLQQYAKVMYLQRRFSEAIIALDRRRQALPLRVETHTDLALALYRAGRIDEAKAVLGGGLEVLGDQRSGPLYFLSGCMYRELGEIEAADQMMAAARARLSPDEMRYAEQLWRARSKKELDAAVEARREELRRRAATVGRAEDR